MSDRVIVESSARRFGCGNALTILLSLTLVATCGCSDSVLTTTPPGTDRSDHSSEGHEGHSVSVKRQILDVGRVAPGTKRLAEFEILNDGFEDWTVRDIKTTCRCTVASVNRDKIPVGARAKVTVEYRAAEERDDDSKTLRVFFKEANAPVILLQLNAHIRSDIDVNPRALSSAIEWGQRNKGCVLMAEINNYSGLKWERVKIDSPVEWLQASVKEGPVLEDYDGVTPTQRWLLSVHLHASELSGGSSRSTLRIRARAGQREFIEGLPVVVKLLSPVRVVPARMIFSRVSMSSESVQQISRITFTGISPPPVDDFTVVHTGQQHVEVKLSKDADGALIVDAHLNTDGLAATGEGVIRIIDKRGRIGPVHIPYLAFPGD